MTIFAISDLIRREQARTELRELVVEGMSSGPGSEHAKSHGPAGGTAARAPGRSSLTG